jgi:ribosome-binding protein aMBF1 (putative translation factor)
MAKKTSSITTFNQHLNSRYGVKGSEQRSDFEIKAKAFLIGELIKEERKNAKMTQEQLADKIGAKKSFISRIENGKTDIQLSTLYRLLEFGLGKTVEVSVN